MKSRILGLLLGLASTLAMGADAPKAKAAGPLAPAEVLNCMQANVPDALRVQELEFETAAADGSVSNFKGRLYMEREPAEGDDKKVRAMLKLLSPPNLSGAAYLIREEDSGKRDGMYVYLPSVKRVRRVTGSFADSGLMGTSFSYADFRLIQNSFDGAELSLEAAETLGSRKVHRLRVHPPQSTSPSGYGDARLWVDQQSCVLLKGEFEQGGAVRKRLTVPPDALKQSGRHWYAAVIEMRDEKEGLRTTVRVRGVSPAEEISGGYFDPSTFYQR